MAHVDPNEAARCRVGHRHRGVLKQTIVRVVRAHAAAGRPAPPGEVVATVLRGLATCDAADLTVAIVDVPGRAVVVTRAYDDELLETPTDGPR